MKDELAKNSRWCSLSTTIPKAEQVLKDRKIYIDVMRILACFGVVVLHVSGDYMRECLNARALFGWKVSFVINMFTRVAVPLFVVISGYLNLTRGIGWQQAVRKCFFRITVPLFLFGTINIFYWKWWYNWQDKVDFVYILKNFIQGPMMFHLWFLYMIIPLYLIIPFIDYLVANISNEYENIIYFLVLWLTASTIATLSTVQGLKVSPFITQMALVTGYLPYYVVGGILKNIEVKINTVVTAAIFVVMIGINVVVTRKISSDLAALNTIFFEPGSSVTLVFATLALFLFIKNFFRAVVVSEHVKQIITTLSALSFGVYLVHPIFQITVL